MRTAKIVLAVLFCATLARAETLEGLSRRIDDIAQGRDSGNQIQDLRVQDDATIGDDLTVSGDAAVTGAATVTGKTTANGELEANADVDINLGSATEEITIDQTNAAGTADVPMCLIRDARTGTTANATNEATIVITAEGTYGLAVTKGGVDFAGLLNVGGASTVAGKTQADGELEANADVDINLGAATEEIDIVQTDTTGQANTPLISISDARTGANANATNEATLMLSAEGTYALAITKGGVDIVGKALAVAPSTTKFMVDRGTCTNGQASVSFTSAFGVAPSVTLTWSDAITALPAAGTNLTLSASSVTTAGFVPNVAALPVGGAYTNIQWIAVGTAP
jgi:hypothetical protein